MKVVFFSNGTPQYRRNFEFILTFLTGIFADPAFYWLNIKARSVTLICCGVFYVDLCDTTTSFSVKGLGISRYHKHLLFNFKTVQSNGTKRAQVRVVN